MDAAADTDPAELGTRRTTMKVTITIKRPEGHIEVVDVSKSFTNMNDTLFSTIKANTKAAGRGEAISYKVECDISAEQLAEIEAENARARWMDLHACSAR
jgi:hypothetical protein